MQKDIEITLPPEELQLENKIKERLSLSLNLDITRIGGYQIIKRSIDARSRKPIYRMIVKVFIDETP